MIVLLLLAVALADPVEATRAQEQTVEQAAAAVASARAQGARRREVAELMAIYRQEAEALARMTPPVTAPGPEATREAALRALAEATVNERADADARAVIEDWLGPLPARLILLDRALYAAATTAPRAPELARSMLLDIEAQCTAVMVAAAHDASLAARTARSARLKAATLRQAEAPRQSGGFDQEMDAAAAERAAAAAEAEAATLWNVRAAASALRERARQSTGAETTP